MPIYEYECRECRDRVEVLVLKGETSVCPHCGGTELERLLSAPRVASDGTRRRSLRGAQAKAEAKRKDKERSEHEGMHHHHH